MYRLHLIIVLAYICDSLPASCFTRRNTACTESAVPKIKEVSKCRYESVAQSQDAPYPVKRGYPFVLHTPSGEEEQGRDTKYGAHGYWKVQRSRCTFIFPVSADTISEKYRFFSPPVQQTNRMRGHALATAGKSKSLLRCTFYIDAGGIAVQRLGKILTHLRKIRRDFRALCDQSDIRIPETVATGGHTLRHTAQEKET